MKEKNIPNDIFIVFDGMIGYGKSTSIRILKDNKDAITKYIIDNSYYNKVTWFFKDERASISPFLKKLYEVLSYDKEEIKSSKKHQNTLCKIEHTFISTMGEDIQRIKQITEDDREYEKNLNIFILDRGIHSVMFFIDFYYIDGLLTEESYQHLKTIINNYEEEIKYSTRSDDSFKELRKVVNVFIDSNPEKGYENVKSRARDGEVMSREYYDYLLKYYNKVLETDSLFGFESKINYINNDSGLTNLKNNVIETIKKLIMENI